MIFHSSTTHYLSVKTLKSNSNAPNTATAATTATTIANTTNPTTNAGHGRWQITALLRRAALFVVDTARDMWAALCAAAKLAATFRRVSYFLSKLQSQMLSSVQSSRDELWYHSYLAAALTFNFVTITHIAYHISHITYHFVASSLLLLYHIPTKLRGTHHVV